VIDVVMETDDAGLQLCDFVRATIPRTTRIVLRTGQPGAAPPEKVMNDYDIDYYLAKTEVTEERLFMILRACFRSSLDIAAMVAVQQQMRSLTAALREVSTTPDTLADIMCSALRFLEDKYGAATTFVGTSRAAPGTDTTAFGPVREAIASAHQQGVATMKLEPGQRFGLTEGTFLVLTSAIAAVDRSRMSVSEKVKSWFQSLVKESEEEGAAGMAVRFQKELPAKVLVEFMQDLELFVGNWRVADATLRLQNRIVRERLDQVKSSGGVV
jgi:hypothetical protein